MDRMWSGGFGRVLRHVYLTEVVLSTETPTPVTGRNIGVGFGVPDWVTVCLHLLVRRSYPSLLPPFLHPLPLSFPSHYGKKVTLLLLRIRMRGLFLDPRPSSFPRLQSPLGTCRDGTDIELRRLKSLLLFISTFSNYR